ncbi:hypothetical protein [Halospeciosus flavus]|nr:hypothetical protein [Halospeciosus flavus]
MEGKELSDDFQIYYLEHKKSGLFQLNQSVWRDVERFRFYSGDDYEDSRERPLTQSQKVEAV